MPAEWKDLPIENFAATASNRSAFSFEARWAILAHDLLDTDHLKIEVSKGEWKLRDTILAPCGPDGYSNYSAPDSQLVLSNCWYCALLGKIGGSTADHIVPEKAGDALAASGVFAIGSFCILEVPTTVKGPLFLGFNCVQRPVMITALDIKVQARKRTSEERNTGNAN